MRTGILLATILVVAATVAAASGLFRHLSTAREPDEPAPQSVVKPASPDPHPGCVAPRPNRLDQIAHVEVYGSQTVSNITFSDPSDPAGVIDVIVEPGAHRLYLILASYGPMVWRISGATERVSKAVLTTALRRDGLPQAGIVGLETRQIGAAYGNACPHSLHRVDPQVEAARRRFTAVIGRLPDVTTNRYDAVSVRLPSGAFAVARETAPVPPGFDIKTWRETARASPGGVARVEPSSIKGAGIIAALDVYPGGFGLAQLVGSGHLRRRHQTYEVVRPIPRFPAGSYGGHSVTFKLAKGIPRPAGDPGHSCVYGNGQFDEDLCRNLPWFKRLLP